MKTLNPQEKTYTIVLNKEKYEKRVAEIENEITNKNYEKAKEMLLEIAKYNKVEYVKIATMYYEAGKTNESEKWFKIAYDKGLKDSIYYMGVIEFEEGNIEKAREYFKESAIKENRAEAQIEYADKLKEEGNIEEAVKWYKKAAEQNEARALIKLCSYYLDKHDVEKANEMVRRLKTTKGLKNYTLEYKKFAHEYKEMKE